MIKKTMIDALAFVTPLLDEENLAKFTKDFCEAKTRSAGAGEPRESVRLFDAEGNTIGRRCSALKLWMAPEEFNGDIEKISICREANKVKTKHNREADAIVRDAEAIRVEANGLEDAMEKLAKYEEYDAKLEEAKQLRATPITIDDVEVNGFETAQELADELGVECILDKPEA
jgi:hypothetical protein